MQGKFLIETVLLSLTDSISNKFVMHCDDRLAYCPLTYILAMAFADRAFADERITPAIFFRLTVPNHLTSLKIPWKCEMLNVPVLRHVSMNPYGPELHPHLPMMYQTHNKLLKRLGHDAGYDIDITHYAFRRWTANEANRVFVPPFMRNN